MPTVLTVGPYKFRFFSTDRLEPRHIHATRGTLVAKFWLDPVSLAKNRGFPDQELNSLARLVIEHQEKLRSAWDDYIWYWRLNRPPRAWKSPKTA
ncbi:DUF4160 domain-containing protein [Longimicrobium sp.]|uniref:DUF4160 domain-containing protein n=1 Tax=Longimicrobium sp. TaxID=2029185 RepID=UPI002C8757FD|nr:DUF4160 domain-containing protein [Longimicrobium sp.]